MPLAPFTTTLAFKTRSSGLEVEVETAEMDAEEGIIVYLSVDGSPAGLNSDEVETAIALLADARNAAQEARGNASTP